MLDSIFLLDFLHVTYLYIFKFYILFLTHFILFFLSQFMLGIYLKNY